MTNSTLILNLVMACIITISSYISIKLIFIYLIKLFSMCEHRGNTGLIFNFHFPHVLWILIINWILMQTTTKVVVATNIQVINITTCLFCPSSTSPSQTDDNKLIKSRIGIHSGVCIHNGIVRKNRDEWTVDDCTECTCQVRPWVLQHTRVGTHFVFTHS